MTKRSEFAAYSSFDGAGERYESEAPPMTMTQEIPAEIMQEARRCIDPLDSLDRAKIGHVNVDAVVHRIARALLARDTTARKECAEIARGKAERANTGTGWEAAVCIATAIEATITGGGDE